MVLAACGGGTGGDRAASVSAKTLQLAAANSSEAESSRFTSNIAVTVAGETVELEMTGVGTGDGRTMSIVMTMPELGSFEFRIVDGVVYIDFGAIPEAAAELPPGKTWVAFDVEELAGVDEGTLRSLSEQAQQNTPKQGLESLEALSGDVEDLGPDTVGGKPATHYRGAIDYTKISEDAELPESMHEAFASLGDSGPVPVDVWIDDQDRVVKMQFAMDIPVVRGGPRGRMEMRMEFTEFGVPVDVQAPSADEVVSYDELTTTDLI